MLEQGDRLSQKGIIVMIIVNYNIIHMGTSFQSLKCVFKGNNLFKNNNSKNH